MNNSTLFFVGVFVIAFLSIIFLFYFPILGKVNSFFDWFLIPIERFMYQKILVFKNFITFALHLKESYQEFNFLQEKNAWLYSELVSCQENLLALKKKNEQDDFAQRSNLRLLQSQVIGNFKDGQNEFFILDKGGEEGVKVGLPVILGQGIVVGKIVKVEGKRSFFLPSVSSNVLFNASLNREINTIGLASGDNHLRLKIDYIPKDILIEKGELLITSGLEDLVPRGLLLGEIENVEEIPGSSFKIGYAKPLYRLSDIFLVSIVLGKKE